MAEYQGLGRVIAPVKNAQERSQDPAVVVEGLSRSFSGRVVLDDLNLIIGRGEFVALLGPSGTGKSTFLRILAGLDHDATGRVIVPRKRAVMFQDARLLPWRSVWHNIVLGIADASSAAPDRVLAEVGLHGSFAKRWPNTLSGGEAQRVALARALMREPDLLLLDEPFGALDALTRIRMQELLAQVHVRHNAAVLLVTHDVEEAILLADRVAVLSQGKFTSDVRVDLAKPRSRSDPQVVALRQALLKDLGVAQQNPHEQMLGVKSKRSIG
jgi:sulfonate transport system ATP-binding protein